jgi:hypothetical protein
MHNLNGQYQFLTGYFGRVDGTSQMGATIRFTTDGQVLREINVGAQDAPVQVMIPVGGVQLLRIDVEFNYITTRGQRITYALQAFLE